MILIIILFPCKPDYEDVAYAKMQNPYSRKPAVRILHLGGGKILIVGFPPKPTIRILRTPRCKVIIVSFPPKPLIAGGGDSILIVTEMKEAKTQTNVPEISGFGPNKATYKNSET